MLTAINANKRTSESPKLLSVFTFYTLNLKELWERDLLFSIILFRNCTNNEMPLWHICSGVILGKNSP